MKKQIDDVLILGGGAAGLMCAAEAGRRGLRVRVVDHATSLGRKILISGGGRCNFTNLKVTAEDYLSTNPHFCKSALSRFTPEHFLERVKCRGIAYHEKKLGQLFCDRSAREILDLLLDDCREAGVAFQLDTRVERVERGADNFSLHTNCGIFEAPRLVVATGGLSLPKLGATGLGYRVARDFGLGVVETAPALDGFRLGEEDRGVFSELSGISLAVELRAAGRSFRENLLWTHHGMSGPAALQASLFWRASESLEIRWAPERDFQAWLEEQKNSGTTKQLGNLLDGIFPKRWVERYFRHRGLEPLLGRRLSQISPVDWKVLVFALESHVLRPIGTVGYTKAEVTRGGVDTDGLSSKTMEAKNVPGLFFIGEVVDVTGRLGGYNFQWAWSSGWAAGQAV